MNDEPLDYCAGCRRLVSIASLRSFRYFWDTVVVVNLCDDCRGEWTKLKFGNVHHFLRHKTALRLATMIRAVAGHVNLQEPHG